MQSASLYRTLSYFGLSSGAWLYVSRFEDMMKLIIMNNLEAFQHMNPHENDIRLLKMLSQTRTNKILIQTHQIWL